MSEGLLIAIIPSCLTLIGVIITNVVTSANNNKKQQKENTKIMNSIRADNTQAINDIKLEITAYHSSTDEKIKELTREVREHNNFAQRMPMVEEKIDNLKEKVNYFHKV